MTPGYAPPDVLWQINLTDWIESGIMGLLVVLVLLAMWNRR